MSGKVQDKSPVPLSNFLLPANLCSYATSVSALQVKCGAGRIGAVRVGRTVIATVTRWVETATSRIAAEAASIRTSVGRKRLGCKLIVITFKVVYIF